MRVLGDSQGQAPGQMRIRPGGHVSAPDTANAVRWPGVGPMMTGGPGMLLEREIELGVFRKALRESACDGRLVVVEGPPGIGKTRLLAQAKALAAESGAAVLSARGSELESNFAFGVVRQLFEGRVLGASAKERKRLFEGAARLALPLFGDPRTGQGEQSGPDVAFTLLHGLFWLLEKITSNRRVMITVDDLQWSDQSSLRWLLYLLPRMEGLPLLIAASVRTAEPGTGQDLLRRVFTDPSAIVLRLAPLSEKATMAFVREALSLDADEVFCRACFDASRGNPLLLNELLGAIRAEALPPVAPNVGRLLEIGAPAVARPVLLRLSRLRPEAARLARASAVLGDGARVETAAALAGLQDPVARQAAEALASANILRSGRALEFIHPIVRAAVYNDIGAYDRSLSHASAARLLSGLGARPEQVAAHLLLTAPASDQWVVASLRTAARAAVAQGAVDVAARYLRRALEEPPVPKERARVLTELGAAETVVSSHHAIAHLEEALPLAGDLQARADTVMLLATNLYMGARYHRLAEVCETALAQSPALGPRPRGVLHGVLFAASILDPSLYAQRRAWIRELSEQATTAPAEQAMLAACIAYHDARAGVPASQVLPVARGILSDGRLFELPTGVIGFTRAVELLIHADDDEVLGLLNDTLASRSPADLTFVGAKLYRGLALLSRGALADAETDLRELLERFERLGMPIGMNYSRAYLADVLMEQGRAEEAEKVLSQPVRGDEPHDHAHLLSLMDSRARLSIVKGETRRGTAELLEAGRRFEAVGGFNPAFLPWRSRAAAALATMGERDRGRELAEQEVDLACRWGAPRAVGRALRAYAAVAPGRHALVLLEEAVRVLDGSLARLELARSLVDLGAALRRRNQGVQAREPLRRGLELATFCGAAPVIEQARAELLATGARPRRVALTGIESLTPSERRVAGMAAGGATNREIAQALFVTAKTVEVHLSNGYKKLGVTARSQLASVLRDVQNQGRPATG